MSLVLDFSIEIHRQSTNHCRNSHQPKPTPEADNLPYTRIKPCNSFLLQLNSIHRQTTFKVVCVSNTQLFSLCVFFATSTAT
eukprot:m.19300 g.19300  ORF g.19300 m.19300 type:complete len:82 (-) comp12403_c0_seq1:259-504(-)